MRLFRRFVVLSGRSHDSVTFAAGKPGVLIVSVLTISKASMVLYKAHYLMQTDWQAWHGRFSDGSQPCPGGTTIEKRQGGLRTPV